jgi:hypothetical protein
MWWEFLRAFFWYRPVLETMKSKEFIKWIQHHSYDYLETLERTSIVIEESHIPF